MARCSGNRAARACAAARFEPLESRLLMAAQIDARTVAFTDVDGDQVTVQISRGTLDVSANFEFAVAGAGEQLQKIDLSHDAQFSGASLSVRVLQAGGGDGLVNVGAIDASGIDLDQVAIVGDLGRIDAGDADPATPALRRLSVATFGAAGVATQSAGGNMTSTIVGTLRRLEVLGDFRDAVLSATANIDAVKIGGSLIGTAEASGRIVATNNIGLVRIGADMRGDADDSARIEAGAFLTRVFIGGSLIGGAGERSAVLTGQTGIGSVYIRGGVQGGAEDSGAILSGADIRRVIIRQSLIGGADEASGRVSAAGSILCIRINGDLIGGGEEQAGQIDAGGALLSTRIRGSVLASSAQTGQIVAADIRSIWIGADLAGGSIESGGAIRSVFVGGSVSGAAHAGSARIAAASDIRSIKIRGDLRGGAGENSATLFTFSSIWNLRVGGTVVGGSGNNSATIDAHLLNKVRLKGDLVGGSVSEDESLHNSGYIHAAWILDLRIDGSLVAGTNDGSETLSNSGAIRADQHIRALSVRGSLLGNESNPLVISAGGPQAIGRISVGRDVHHATILGGYGADNQRLNADAQIELVRVGGNWLASSISAGTTGAGPQLTPELPTHFATTGDVKLSGAGVSDEPDIFSRIGIIRIKGQATSDGGNATFGFSAELIELLELGENQAALSAGPHNDDLPLATGVRLREV